jgi:hypothetical protein
MPTSGSASAMAAKALSKTTVNRREAVEAETI